MSTAIAGRSATASRTAPPSAPTRSSPRAGARTTPGAGSTTAMSSPTRTPAWPAGSWSTRNEEGRSLSRIPLIAPLLTLALAAPAMAADYPAPSDPGTVQAKPKGPFHTRTVCAKGKKSKHCFKTIQKAINAAKPGDTVKVPDGVWKEGVKIQGAKKRFIKLIGNIAHPEKVVFEGKSLKGVAKANGVLINRANEVTVRGFTAQNHNG